MPWRRSLATLFILIALVVNAGGVAAQGAGPASHTDAAGRGPSLPGGPHGPANGINPLTQVVISGPIAGYSGTTYAFTAASNPITATTPITYVWEATDQSPVTHVGLISDTVSFSWNTPGTKTVTVTATNLGGDVLDTHDVDLNAPNLYLPIVMKSCPPLFADDFSNPASGWDVADTGSTLFQYLGGEYRILIRNALRMAGDYQGFQATDYVAQVDVRIGSSVYGAMGLAFGISADWTQFYEFDVDPDGFYSVYRHDPGVWVKLTSGSSAAINLSTATNRLKVMRSGSAINVYANGQLLASLADSTYQGSRFIGLIAFSYNQPNFDARFDNIRVDSIACAPATVQANPSSGLGQPRWFAAPADRPR